MANKIEIGIKRAAVAAKIKEVAPSIDLLVGMLDEMKLDLILLALANGKVIPHD